MKFIGSDGVMTATASLKLTLDRTPRPDEFDWAIESFAEKMQKELTAAWKAKHPEPSSETSSPARTEVFDTQQPKRAPGTS